MKQKSAVHPFPFKSESMEQILNFQLIVRAITEIWELSKNLIKLNNKVWSFLCETMKICHANYSSE